MSSRRVPDPDKWVSANKVARTSTQRPIVDARFRAHCGIATPPPSTSRKRSNPRPSTAAPSVKKAPIDVTPTAPQKSIASFFTPPTTGIGFRGKGKAKEEPEEPSPLVREASVFPSSLPRRTRGSHRLSEDRSEEDIDRTPVASSSQVEITQVPSHVLARHRKLCGEDDDRPKPISPWRREAGLVDIDEELEYQREERHYEDKQRAEERAAKRRAIDERAQDVISAQAVERVRGARERRNLGEFKSLVHLSSSTGSSSPRHGRQSSPSERAVLAQVPLNTLARHSSAVEAPVSERDALWPKSKRSVLPSFPVRPRRMTPQQASLGTPRKRPQLSLSPKRSPKTAKKKRSLPVSPKARSPQVTPRKRRSPHHKLTPPKSRTPQKYGNQQETLFVFPEPPSKPVFEPIARQRSVNDWQPVDMEAETLLTWSMGPQTLAPSQKVGGVESRPLSPELVGEDDDCESIAGSVASQSFPRLVESWSPSRRLTRGVPSPLKRLPFADFDAMDLPKSPSPVIHQFLSPEAPPEQPSQRTIPSSLPSEPESPPPESSSPSPKPLVRRADKEAKKRVGLFSSVCEEGLPIHPPASAPRSRSTPRSTRSRSTQSRGSSSRTSQSTNQTKLEAFGYFAGDRPARPDFAQPFSDEEDLDFGDEKPLFSSPPKHSRLGPVPEAPPHPSLRTAGVRELARRESKAMARHHAQSSHQSNSPSDHSTDFEIPHASSDSAVIPLSTDASSLDGHDDVPRVSRATRDWWDRLGEREDSL